jgi:CHAT domain
METQESTLSTIWLNSLGELLRGHDYSEAFTLADFFPATPERVSLQFVALLGQKNLSKAESFLTQTSISPQRLPIGFSTLLRRVDLDLLGIATDATKQLRFSTALFCIELYLVKHPEDFRRAIENMSALASRALLHDRIDIGNACFDRMITLDSSPSGLLKSAEVALANRTRNSREALLELAQSFIRRALFQIPEDAYDSRIKAGSLLAVDERTFGQARELFLQVIRSCPSMTSRVVDTLLPLTEYKSYFREIVDFLIDIAPQQAAEIMLRLVRGYRVQRDSGFLEKAHRILDKVEYMGQQNSSQLAAAIVSVGKESENLEGYAQRLLNLEAPAAVFFDAIKLLISRQSKEFRLIEQLLDYVLLRHPDSRLEVLWGYGQLCHLAEVHKQPNLKEEYLERSFTLSNSAQEFLEHGVNASITNQLLFLKSNEPYLRNAPWHKEGEIDDVVLTLIATASSNQRRNALYLLLSDRDQFDTRRLIVWIRALFQSDLELTRRDVSQLQEMLPIIALPIQKEITDGLTKQKVQERFAIHHGAGAVANSLLHMSNNMVALLPSGIDRSKVWELIKRLEEEGIDPSELLTEDLFEDTLLRKRGKVSQKAPTKRVERHTRIEFPRKCALEKKTELKIQLTKTPPLKTRARKKLKIDVPPKVKKINVEINVTAPTFAMQERRKGMSMLLNNDSEEVTFTLIPVELGEQVIEVEFFYESVRVGYVLVKTHVSAEATMESSSNVLVMETPSEALKNAETLRVNSDRRVLHTTWFDKESKLSYTVYSPGVNESPEWETSRSDLQGDVRTYLQQLNEFLSQAVALGEPTDGEWDSILLNLQGIGANLFTTLIPSALAAQVHNWKKGSLVIVSTNEQWIPWELVYDGQDFWGKRFVIARLPRLSDRRNLSDGKRPESKRKTRQLKRVLNVVGGDIGLVEAKKASDLFGMLDSRVGVDVLLEQPISALNTALPKADVLHCTCHGHLDPHMLQVSKDRSLHTNLLPNTVQKLLLEPGSFVFANTCTSALPVLTFGRFSSFAWEFYRRGAGVFVGTLGAVPTAHAISFARLVYGELFNGTRKTTVGQALSLAKKAVAKERNLFWMLYCIYGDPDYALKISR